MVFSFHKGHRPGHRQRRFSLFVPLAFLFSRREAADTKGSSVGAQGGREGCVTTFRSQRADSCERGFLPRLRAAPSPLLFFFSPSLNALTGWLSRCGLWRGTGVALRGGDAAGGRVLEERRREGDGDIPSFDASEKDLERLSGKVKEKKSTASLPSHCRSLFPFRLPEEKKKSQAMRGLLSAARRTGVLGKNNASPGPAAAASGLLPSRRVPSAGLGPPLASLSEAQKEADRSHRRRRPRRLPPRAAAAAAAAEPSPAASAAPRDDSEGEKNVDDGCCESLGRQERREKREERGEERRRWRRRKNSAAPLGSLSPPPHLTLTPPHTHLAAPPPPPSFVVPPSEAYFGDLADPGVIANNTGLQLLFLGTGAGPAPTRGR